MRDTRFVMWDAGCEIHSADATSLELPGRHLALDVASHVLARRRNFPAQ